jgi:hypothetical protein
MAATTTTTTSMTSTMMMTTMGQGQCDANDDNKKDNNLMTVGLRALCHPSEATINLC